MVRRLFPLFLLVLGPQSARAAEDCREPFRQVGEADRGAEATHEVLREIEGSLFERQAAATPAQAQAWNAELLRTLDGLPVPTRNPRRLGGFTAGQIQALFQKVERHPVVDNRLWERYDPEHRGIGFCFGRALAGHVEALRMGIDRDSVRKIWAVGNLRTPDGQHWSHHVATMVRGTDGGWWVIDPNVLAPERLTDFMKRMQPQDQAGNLQFFATQARRFGPEDARAILPGTTRDPFYNHYFTDYLRSSRDEARQLLEARRAARARPPAATR